MLVLLVSGVIDPKRITLCYVKYMEVLALVVIEIDLTRVFVMH
jgi:hypothetical protein